MEDVKRLARVARILDGRAAPGAGARVPADGDVLIRSIGSRGDPGYALCTVPGPDQLRCATRAEAEGVARAYAAHAHVDVWTATAANRFTVVTQGREPAHERSFPASRDGVPDPVAQRPRSGPRAAFRHGEQPRPIRRQSLGSPQSTL